MGQRTHYVRFGLLYRIANINQLKTQFLADMELAGLAPASRKTYLDAIEQLIKRYWRSPAA